MQNQDKQVLSMGKYNIFVGEVWPALSVFLKEQQFSSIVIIVDENTRRHCLPHLPAYLPLQAVHLLEVPSGELNKNIKSCEDIWQFMMDSGVDRHSLCINLGGGVIGDMGGFCASTFKRGMTFIQIPTTLLSQVDASIGGKLGVDFGTVKNSIGLFRDPAAVMIYPEFLKTLPVRELRSGFAEMIKHSLIADADHWEELRQQESLEQLSRPEFILTSLRIKKRIVEADPEEHGIRKALNFGHTIGHAIEGAVLDSADPLLHGEAIAIGMICEAWLGKQKLGLSDWELEQICSFIVHHFGKIHLDIEQASYWLKMMRADKKNKGESINFTLLSAIGKYEINQICEPDEIFDSIQFYQSL